ncbi:BON domain-containing protein [Gemmatimonas phototrophica]|uniref:BON domain-containing protein n=1 Tax=Gemmatimonas phototrophica TaxID=1379270 RepID=UPI0006A6C4A1|nr:BON domain-containing protein [Gemmatimonas phototrophica]
MSIRLIRIIPLAALLLCSAAACSNTADGVKQDASNATEKTAEAGAEAGDAMSGAAKTADVKAALLADTLVAGMEINVDTKEETKTVTLSGVVPSEGVRDRAIQVAQNNATGYTVVDNLTIRSR